MTAVPACVFIPNFDCRLPVNIIDNIQFDNNNQQSIDDLKNLVN